MRSHRLQTRLGPADLGGKVLRKKNESQSPSLQIRKRNQFTSWTLAHSSIDRARKRTSAGSAPAERPRNRSHSEDNWAGSNNLLKRTSEDRHNERCPFCMPSRSQ